MCVAVPWGLYIHLQQHGEQEALPLGDHVCDLYVLLPAHLHPYRWAGLSIMEGSLLPWSNHWSSVNMSTLIDIILTNLPSKFIACIRYGSEVKQPPLITFKCSLKHFCVQAFLIDLARVSWKDMVLIPSVEDTWSFFKSNFHTILDKHALFKKCKTKNRNSPWFTPDLNAIDQRKNILWWTAIALNSPRDMLLFREVRNKYT